MTGLRTVRIFICSLLLCFFLPGAVFRTDAYAAAWPAFETELTAEAAVVYDADTGTVLYGKDAYVQHCPASVTKLLTALLVAENCPDLDEMVVFSKAAVSGLESGAVTAGTSEGDELSVRDCLYALILHSANEVANALAEHVSGSVEDFCVLMNERARELGCLSTHFVNPNGLTSDVHLTTAYDLALIGTACMNNETVMSLWDREKNCTYTIGPTKRNPNGYTFSVGHKMLKRGSGYTDARVVGGKTGFTTQSGNTLVTLAEDGGRRIVSVVLKDKNPQHYADTAALLDFGFSQFETDEVTELLDLEELRRRLNADTVLDGGEDRLYTEEAAYATLPAGADPSELEFFPEYNRGRDWPEAAVCELVFRYAGVRCGSVPVLNEHELTVGVVEEQSDPAGEPAEPEPEKKDLRGLMRFLLFAAAAAGLSIPAVIIVRGRRRERRLEEERKKRRAERLKSMNISEEEFEHLLSERRKSRGEHRGETGTEHEAPGPDSGEADAEPEHGEAEEKLPESPENGAEEEPGALPEEEAEEEQPEASEDPGSPEAPEDPDAGEAKLPEEENASGGGEGTADSAEDEDA